MATLRNIIAKIKTPVVNRLSALNLFACKLTALPGYTGDTEPPKRINFFKFILLIQNYRKRKYGIVYIRNFFEGGINTGN